MNNKLPVLPLYANDFIADVVEWTNEEVGIHIKLLCYQWINGSIPNDTESLARMTGTSHSSFVYMWERVGGKYVPNDKGRLINERLEKERKEVERYKQMKSNAGKVGGGNPNFKKGLANPYYKPTGKTSTKINTDINRTLTDEKTNALTKDKPSSSSSSSSSISNKNKKEKSGFQPPTLAEVKDFCLSNEINIDAEHFYHYWESVGWLKVKSWQAKVYTWHKNEKKRSSDNSQATHDVIWDTLSKVGEINGK
jgi:uncharacterized protein YdaU (DUF1376 family)